VRTKCRATANLWADTDEEDNADSGDENAKDKDGNEDQVKMRFTISKFSKVLFMNNNFLSCFLKSRNFAIILVEPFIFEDSDRLLTLKEFFCQEGK